MKISFKAAEIADELILATLRREFDDFEPFPKRLDEATNRAALRQLIENELYGKIWLISADEETVGYVVLIFGYSLEYAGRDALIDELFLREAARNRGIGRETLNFITDFCRRIDIKAIHLEVEHTNKRAQAVYHRAGFVDHDRYFLTKWIDSF